MNVRHGRRRCAPHLCLAAWLSLLVAVGATRAEAQTKAYVAHPGANLVTVIDTATDTAAGTVAVGAGPIKVVVARDGTRAYVINRDSADVSLIDTTSDAVVATIPIGGTPAGLALTPDGASLYVTTAAGLSLIHI